MTEKKRDRTEYNRAYRAAHPEERAAYDKSYYAAHPEEISAQKRSYYQAHRPEILARRKVHNAEHREEKAAYNKVYYATHPEENAARGKAYRAEHPEEIAAYMKAYYATEQGRIVKCAVQQRRRARKLSALGADYTTAAMIKARCELWGNRCYICGGPMEAIDHVKPLAKGGAHLPCNLRPICKSCNSKKRDKWPYPSVLSRRETEYGEK